MKAKILVYLKNGVLDPQGKAILNAAHSLGFVELQEIRLGKFFEVDLASDDPALAKKQLEVLSSKLLANTVIENFKVEIVES